MFAVIVFALLALCIILSLTVAETGDAIVYTLINLGIIATVFIVISSLFHRSYGDNEDKIRIRDRIAVFSILILSCSWTAIWWHSGNAGEVIMSIIIGIIFFFVPFVLTYINIKNLVTNNNNSRSADLVTIVLGGIYWIMLLSLTMNLTGKPYYEAIYPNEKHEIISSEYGGILMTVFLLSVIALFILCSVNLKKLSPILSAFSVSFTVIGLIIFLFIHIQLSENMFLDYNPLTVDRDLSLMLWLYYTNLVIISVRRIRFHITENVRIAKERQTVYRSKFAFKLAELVSDISKMTLFSFILIIPIAAAAETLYILFGQGADGVIKAFTETADWTFSQQTPPPPLEYSGHYLCTVAAGGHEKIVKPLRYGRRRGKIIVVNRQLLTANAFEDLIAEKAPKFHRAVRTFYDKHGYPVSKHITTQLRADIVYIAMKPLEWLFILTLYLFDTHPENRIAVQYSDYKNK